MDINPEEVDELLELVARDVLLRQPDRFKADGEHDKPDCTKSSVEPNEDKPKDTKNAERCRASRAKRKEELATLKRENVGMKRDRGDLLKSIASLEQQVQELRGRDAVDLKKENELLLAEVKRYRCYVERIMGVVEDVRGYSKQDVLNSLKIGISGNVSRIVGMLYSSLADPSWRSGDDVDFREEIKGKVWSQFLPTDSQPKDAARLNLRVDMCNIPRKAEYIADKIRKGNLDIQGSEDFYAGLQLCAESDYKQIVATTSSSEAKATSVEGVAAWSIGYPKDNPTHEILYACSSAKADLEWGAYAYKKACNRPKFPISANVIVNATTDCTLHRSRKKIEGTWFEGYVVTEESPNCSTLSFVLSTPLNPNFLAVLYPYAKFVDPQQMNLVKEMKAYMDHHLKVLLAGGVDIG